MTTATQKTILGEFAIEYLGIDSPLLPRIRDRVYPVSFLRLRHRGHRRGGLEDCLEMMAQSAGFDFDELAEQRIRAEYGACDTTTVAERWGGRKRKPKRFRIAGKGVTSTLALGGMRRRTSNREQLPCDSLFLRVT